MRMGKKKFNITNCQCPDCSHVINIPRLLGRERENGHKKDLWCIKCKKITTHIEQKKEWSFENNQFAF